MPFDIITEIDAYEFSSNYSTHSIVSPLIVMGGRSCFGLLKSTTSSVFLAFSCMFMFDDHVAARSAACHDVEFSDMSPLFLGYLENGRLFLNQASDHN